MYRRRIPHKKKPFNSGLKLGNWAKLFSIKPSILLIHNSDDGNVINAVTGEFITNSSYTQTVGKYGSEVDTNATTTATNIPMPSGSAISFFTFCRYNNNSKDHNIVSYSGQDPAIWADVSGGPLLRPSMFAGTAIYGTANSLTNTVAGYQGELGYHCWGAVMISNSAASAIYRNGIQDATGNPGAWTTSATASMYSNGGSKAADANKIWTIGFEGGLPQEEAEFITDNPEALYSILKGRSRFISFPASVPASGRIMSSLTASGGLAGHGGLAGKGGGLAGG